MGFNEYNTGGFMSKVESEKRKFCVPSGLSLAGGILTLIAGITSWIWHTTFFLQMDGCGACFLEVGHGQSAFVKGRFLSEHKPESNFICLGEYDTCRRFYSRSTGCTTSFKATSF